MIGERRVRTVGLLEKLDQRGPDAAIYCPYIKEPDSFHLAAVRES